MIIILLNIITFSIFFKYMCICMMSKMFIKTAQEDQKEESEAQCTVQWKLK